MTLRGQNLSGTTFRDGLPDVSTTGGAEMIDLSLMDRVEAIEGPAGTLYGISSSGGIINAVTKAPLDTPYDSIKVTIGSYNVHRVDYDSTGPMDDSKRWSYRFIFADQSGTISMGGPDDALVAGLMTRYNFTEGKGFVLVRLTYEDIERGTNEYPWFDDDTGHVSTFLSRNNPIPEKDAYREHKTTRFDAELDRNFKTGPIDWSARAAVRAENLSNIVSRLYEQADSFYQFFNSQGIYIGNMDNTSFKDPRIADIQVVQRTRSPASSKVQYGMTDIDALGKSQFGAVDNTLLVYAFEQSAYELDLTNSGPYPGIDLFHPFHYADPDTVASPEVQSNNSLSFNVTEAAAFQDNASLFQNKLILVVGARYDRKTQTSLNRITNVKVYNDVRAGTSHKLGVVVRPIDPLSVYYDYSETFNPSTFNQFTGAKYPNLLSENREAGFKFDAFRNQLVINTAVFNTTTSNVIIQEGNIIGPGGLLEGISGPGGTLKTDGWESDGTWSIGRNFALLAGMGALNSKTATGAYARAVPLGFNYKGFAKYTFTIAPLTGLFRGLWLRARFHPKWRRHTGRFHHARLQYPECSHRLVGRPLEIPSQLRKRRRCDLRDDRRGRIDHLRRRAAEFPIRSRVQLVKPGGLGPSSERGLGSLNFERTHYLKCSDAGGRAGPLGRQRGSAEIAFVPERSGTR